MDCSAGEKIVCCLLITSRSHCQCREICDAPYYICFHSSVLKTLTHNQKLTNVRIHSFIFVIRGSISIILFRYLPRCLCV
jgi:hypothetical protein